MSFDVRIRLTPTERVQWEADTARIASKLGHLPYKHMILPAIHVFALLLDQLDRLDMGALAKVMFK